MSGVFIEQLKRKVAAVVPRNVVRVKIFELKMFTKEKHICPVERAGSLDNEFRRWIQNPKKILQPYIKEDMTVMDVGCGPGFFSVELAEMVGDSGRVIAVDLSRLKPNGQVLIVEPPIHISKSDFQETINIVEKVGLEIMERPTVFLSKTVVMKKI